MTLAQWIGVWLVVAAFVVLSITGSVVALGLYVIFARQDARRHGLRREGSRPEAGRQGRMGPGGDGASLGDRETLARVGWVGIESRN